MQNKYLTILIIALTLAACHTMPGRQAAQEAPHSADRPAVATHWQQPTQATDSGPPDLEQAPPTRESAPIAAPAYTDVWRRIGDKLYLDRHLHQARVKQKLAWFSRKQAYLDRIAERARPYIYFIVEQLEKRQMPLELALLPVVESAYQPFAYSSSHASGIWQFIPATGRTYGLKQNWWYDGRRDIVASTHAALDYLEKLQAEFKGDWLLALAAYNYGEHNVTRAIRHNQKAGKKTDFWSLRLPRETRHYVPSLLAVAELVAQPQKHRVEWQTIANRPYFAQIDAGEQLDLAIVARLAELSMEEVYTLNPGFNRWATDPAGPHRIIIPLAKKALFEQGLSTLSANDKVSWEYHIIKRGETLGQIAARHHISLAALKRTNNLRGDLIHSGHSLLIPRSQQPLQHYTLSMDSRRYRGLQRGGNGQKYIYKVRKGDTLWDIGRQYGVSVRQLCTWNGMSSRSLLRPGQKLSLWFSEQADQARLRPVSLSQATPIRYTVKRGDSLWLIANRFGVTVMQIEQWNNISKSKHLQPGQTLTLQPRSAKGA